MYLKRYELDEQIVSQLSEEIEPEVEQSLSRYLKWNLIRYFMIVSCKVNHFKVQFAGSQLDPANSNARAPIARRPSELSLSNLFASLYLISVLGLIVNNNYQRRYDYYKYHQNRIHFELGALNQSDERAREFHSPGIVYDSYLRELGQFIDASVASSRANLDRLGGPLKEASFSGQFFTWTWLAASFATYMSALLFRKRLTGLDSYLVSAIFDRRAQRLKMGSMIRQEVNAFIESSRNYTETIIRNYLSMDQANIKQSSGLNLKQGSALRRHILDYRSTALSLRSMISDGRLWLFDRNLGHLLRLLKLYFWENFVFLLAILIFWSGVLVSVVWLELLEIKLETLMDWLIWFELIFVSVLTLFAGSTYLNLLHTSWMDQSKLLERLDRKVQLSIGAIELLNGQLASKADAKTVLRRRLEANEQLLEVLLNYRLYLRQLGQIRFLFDYVAFAQLSVMFITPLVARVHSPYVSPRIRYAMIIWTFYSLWFTLPSIFIVCQFGERCLKLYKSLWILMAHTIRVADLGRDQQGHFFDQHTLWTFRQELSHSDLVRRRLAPHFMFISFTYPNLTRLLFWYGLIVLSIAMDSGSSSNESLLGGLLNDPLGIFQPNPSWTGPFREAPPIGSAFRQDQAGRTTSD